MLVSCKTDNRVSNERAATETTVPVITVENETPLTETPIQVVEKTSTPASTPTVKVMQDDMLTALPPEPQLVEFQAEDGETISGVYYPGAKNPSPLVILMHWAPGDQSDWEVIAPWLQNRGQVPMDKDTEGKPWLDISWFPDLTQEESYAVFTFTFRECEGGCREFLREKWLLDVQAAVETALTLDGIDKDSILIIGASIGADGAVDGCEFINSQKMGTCLGAISLSPGSYLTLEYSSVVTKITQENPLTPVWCFYSVNDRPAAGACQSGSGEHYKTFEYEGDRHGMMLIDKHVDPNVLESILAFVRDAFGE